MESKEGLTRTGDDDNRHQFIREMQDFIQRECSEISDILATLSWTPDHVLKTHAMVQCPHDKNHLMPESSLKQHAAVCNLKKMGLSDEEVELQLQNDDIFYAKADLVGKVELDEGLLNRIIWNSCMEKGQVHLGHRTMPISADDQAVKLTPQERAAVYDHCVQVLKGQGKMANVEKDEVLTTDWERIIKKGMLEGAGEKPKSKLELYVFLRDQKRRRQSYRAKNVHITKKSYTEIIREVISNQMEILIPSDDRTEAKPNTAAAETEKSHGFQAGESSHSTSSRYAGDDKRSRSQRSRSRSHARRESPVPRSRSSPTSRRSRSPSYVSGSRSRSKRSRSKRSRSPASRRSRSPSYRSGSRSRSKRSRSPASRRSRSPSYRSGSRSHSKRSRSPASRRSRSPSYRSGSISRSKRSHSPRSGSRSRSKRSRSQSPNTRKRTRDSRSSSPTQSRKKPKSYSPATPREEQSTSLLQKQDDSHIPPSQSESASTKQDASGSHEASATTMQEDSGSHVESSVRNDSYDEGEIRSDEEDLSASHSKAKHKHPKRKSSKHKKHKHKKHRSKSPHSSDFGY